MSRHLVFSLFLLQASLADNITDVCLIGNKLFQGINVSQRHDATCGDLERWWGWAGLVDVANLSPALSLTSRWRSAAMCWSRCLTLFLKEVLFPIRWIPLPHMKKVVPFFSKLSKKLSQCYVFQPKSDPPRCLPFALLLCANSFFLPTPVPLPSW